MKRGFSLIELLVAMAVFSIMAALAYGGLNSIARTRGDLAKQEADFGNLMRAVGSLDRDLNGAVVRHLDQFPLRVTVTILYQGQWDAEQAPAVSVVSWIVPP